MEQPKTACRQLGELETKITAQVSELVEEFKRNTGFCPESINIQLLEDRTIGRDIEYLVIGTTVDVRLTSIK